MTIGRTVLAACAALMLAAPALSAQDAQWRLSPFVITGAFPTDLIPEGERDVIMSAPFTIGRVAQEAVVTDGYGFTSFTGLGAGVMWRKARFGVEGTFSLMPTAAAAVGTVQFDGCVEGEQEPCFGSPETEASGIGFRDNTTVQGKIQTTQNLLASSLSLTLFSGEWLPGRPPPAYEFFFSAGGGLMTYLDDEPLNGWTSGDTSFMGQVGAGAYLNFTQNLLVRVEVRDYIFSTEVGEGLTVDGTAVETTSKLQHGIVFAPGITIIP